MKFKDCDEFSVDLFDSGLHNGLTLCPDTAIWLLGVMGRLFARSGIYKGSRDETLKKAIEQEFIEEIEREAYKDFIDRFYQRRARAAREEKKHA